MWFQTKPNVTNTRNYDHNEQAGRKKNMLEKPSTRIFKQCKQNMVEALF